MAYKHVHRAVVAVRDGIEQCCGLKISRDDLAMLDESGGIGLFEQHRH